MQFEVTCIQRASRDHWNLALEFGSAGVVLQSLGSDFGTNEFRLPRETSFAWKGVAETA